MDSQKKSSPETDKTGGLSADNADELVELPDTTVGDEDIIEGFELVGSNDETTDDDKSHDFEVVNVNDEPMQNLDQGYDMHLGTRIRLSHREINHLTKVLDDKLQGTQRTVEAHHYDIPHSITSLPGFELNASDSANDAKLKQIPIIVEQFNGRVLVKIGPHDLSGVGGIRMREAIIENLVNQALAEQGIVSKTYRDVDVCANISVRGRKQMLLGFFSRKDPGSHQNAFIKVAGETALTRWEPRDGPQSFFNDTICAMAVTVMSALFEYGLRTNKIDSSGQATQLILKGESIKNIFDKLLKMNKGRITHLVDTVNAKKDDILTPTRNKGHSPQ